LCEGFPAGSGFRYGFHIGFGADQGRDPFPKQRMVIYDKDPNRFLLSRHDSTLLLRNSRNLVRRCSVP
jgi:hypothetical protein